ncbi:MAG: hypothetical protein WBL37_09200 [Dehalococcoidales bacterium]|jgi:hypothetical protein
MSTASFNWIKVSKQMHCPICDKPDWCMIARDGSAALCARVESDRAAGTKGSGWIHRLTDNPQPSLLVRPPIIPKKNEEYPRASRERVNLVYNLLLSELTLSDHHRENLHRRGLTDDQIAEFGYETLPQTGNGIKLPFRGLPRKRHLI